ncbi:hypothetical protein PG999_008230 [Apiospora kogelbergensis]|uniref:GAT domain-containing protein n=1 Tax=Apiospora kogelbergensis TaxID=1337665 RepID=A0AAW0QSC2_9PEZI
MKSLKMGKMLGTIRRKNTNGAGDDPQGDGPEAVASRAVVCQGTRLQILLRIRRPQRLGRRGASPPPIVESAESSPAAAAECARLIRKYLKKDYWTRPSYQYNAIMLMRILADNPGQTFTRNMDQKFADTMKDLLRNGRDLSVMQMLMESLNTFETTKAWDEGLKTVIDMWKKEKEKAQKGGWQPQPPLVQQARNAPPFASPPNANPHSQNYFSRQHQSRKLPDPIELASRLEEARTSAKLLQQVVTNTPPGEVLNNDLIKEFADRCTSASRSVQGYMAAENPTPDNDTMESLIDTNEQLQTALSLHQRAMLNARKHAGLGAPAETPSPQESTGPQPNGAGSHQRPTPPLIETDDEEYAPPAMPPRKSNGKGKEREYDNSIAGPSRSHTPRAEEDPFKDPQPDNYSSGAAGGSGSAGATGGGASSGSYLNEDTRLSFEPFHPGFNATPSYLGRQDSSVGKETMHGAAGGEDRMPRIPDDENVSDAAQQKSKGPTMYRY